MAFGVCKVLGFLGGEVFLITHSLLVAFWS